MTADRARTNTIHYLLLAAILILFAALSIVGITWGLPSRDIDKYLFGDGPVWSGEKIYRLAGAAGRFSSQKGADVDVDPLKKSGGEPILLTDSDEDIAKIYMRYRLFTYQPDEMIVMMALSGMKPHELQFDPRLYQYGGLFLYPVGGLIATCGKLGLIDVRSDLVYYLDHPAEFGKFYIVARAYAAAWGLLGVLLVFAIGRRLGGPRAGLLAALLFTLMPVVICMSHEGKPHLPGAVLMLAAVWFAMRYLETGKEEQNPEVDALEQPNVDGGTTNHEESTNTHGAHSPLLAKEGIGGGPAENRPSQPEQENTGCHASREAEACPNDGISHLKTKQRDWWLMCICCGAALGMVLSSLPIFVLIPLVAWLTTGRPARVEQGGIDKRSLSVDRPKVSTPWRYVLKRTILGVAVASGVYLIANPYIVINAFTNREVLRSNFGNSLAMYEVARVGEGLVRVLELTAEGATLPILLLGIVALLTAIIRKKSAAWPLIVPALVFFLQFVLIGAGKPAEYGRFGIFTNTALIIGSACLLAQPWTRLRAIVNWMPTVFVVVWIAGNGGAYLHNFHVDALGRGSRRPAKLSSGSISYDPFAAISDGSNVAVFAEPAPYSLPPMNFARLKIWLCSARDQVTSKFVGFLVEVSSQYSYGPPYSCYAPPRLIGIWQSMLNPFLYRPTPISWANKPFVANSFRGSEHGKSPDSLGSSSKSNASP